MYKTILVHTAVIAGSISTMLAAAADNSQIREECLSGFSQLLSETDIIESITSDSESVSVTIDKDIIDQLEPEARTYIEMCIDILTAPTPED